MIAFLCYMLFFRTQNQKYLLFDVYLTSNLRGHDPLSLLDEVTLGALAVAVLARPLVTLQPRDDAVVAAPRALRPPQRVLARPGVHPRARWSA